MKKYIAKAFAKPGKTLIGGVKQWKSAPQPARENAEAILSAYVDGQKESVLTSEICLVKMEKWAKRPLA